MKIVLIGYRASGKTTVGRLVAERLGWPYLDVDRSIEQRSGKTIKALFEEDGERVYRDVETQVVAELCARDRCVISFGARTIMTTVNQQHAVSNALIVYLEAPAEELWRRMQADPQSATTRLNLSSGGVDEVVDMLQRRAPVYRRCAGLALDAALYSKHLADRIVRSVSKQSRS